MDCFHEYTFGERTKKMFEDIKKNIPKYPDVSGICRDTIYQSVEETIAKEYEDFLLHEFEKRGYTREELQSGKHKLEKRTERSRDGQEIYKYLVDDKLVLEVSSRYEIILKNQKGQRWKYTVF